MALDDLHPMCVALIQQQQQFARAGKPAAVELAFHYTNSQNLHNIRRHGLLDRASQEQEGVSAELNGKKFGDGVYAFLSALMWWHTRRFFYFASVVFHMIELGAVNILPPLKPVY